MFIANDSQLQYAMEFTDLAYSVFLESVLCDYVGMGEEKVVKM